ncbi:MAG: ABC transporter ATP-binding protein [Acidimicrobiales bacterium]
MTVEARAVTRTYRSGDVTVEALRGVDLRVAQGEFVAIMGPSGSGKSTLLHLLAGLDTPSSGEVLIAGRSLAGLSRRELAGVRNRTVGLVFQFFNLVSSLTAWENVALPAVIDGRRDAAYRPRVDALLETVGLGDKADRYPASLSGGEQQRLAVARAMCLQPSVLLADEPTGNLDSKSAAGVLDLIRSQRGEGQTIILVTHDAKVAAQADRLVTMRDGEITADDQLTGGRLATVGEVVQLGEAR